MRASGRLASCFGYHNQTEPLPASEVVDGVGGHLEAMRSQMTMTWSLRRGKILDKLNERLPQLSIDARDLLQLACADAVGAFFVFLDLLERDADGVGEGRLAHVEHKTPHADASADMVISGVYWMPHLSSPLSGEPSTNVVD
jgi:hypothetical protein